MTSIYINYPNPHFSAKPGPVAERIRHEKPERRAILLSPSTFGPAMVEVESVLFAATAELNELWLEIDFDNPEFEMALGKYVQETLGKRYRRLAQAEWK